MGDFFLGFAQQIPDVFKGESCVWGSRWLHLFVFSRHRRFWYKIEVQPTHYVFFFLCWL